MSGGYFLWRRMTAALIPGMMAGEQYPSGGGERMDQLGKWAFIVGIVICVVAGLVVAEPWMFWVLAVLGLVVGFMNITGEETKTFLLAAIGLMLSASSIMGIPLIGVAVTAVLANVVAFMAAAVLIVALKSLFEVAKD
jgi:hypothetical protein